MTRQQEVEAKFGGPENLLGQPTISGLMFEGKPYNELGNGFTDTVAIVGHSILTINDFYKPYEIRRAISDLGEDTEDPMLRAMLEVYYSGGRDIVLWTAAPAEEYVADLEDRLEIGAGRGSATWANLDITAQYEQINIMRAVRNAPELTAPSESEWDNFNFYERYAKRLEIAYEYLIQFDGIDILVPIHAPFYGAGDVDFLLPLAYHCRDAHTVSGYVRTAIIGTAYETVTDEVFNDLLADTRIRTLNLEAEVDAEEIYPGGSSGASGKYVLTAIGNALFSRAEMTVTYSGPIAASAAGELSKLPLNRGLTNKKLTNVVHISGNDFSRAQVTQLCDAKLNPLIKTPRARRGEMHACVLATDNTLGKDGSDYWTSSTVRLVQHCIARIRLMGNKSIGNIELEYFKKEVARYLLDLASDDIIRDFQLNIFRRKFEDDPNRTVIVEVALRPYVGVRTIYFTAEVGNGDRV